MRGNHDMRDERLASVSVGDRSAARSYSRKAAPAAVEKVWADAQFAVSLSTLSLLTCAAAFMVVYVNWAN